MNDNLKPLTLKRQLSKEGKLLLVRSLSHDEDNDADNTIMIGANDDGSVNTLAQSLTFLSLKSLFFDDVFELLSPFESSSGIAEKSILKSTVCQINRC